MWKASISSAYCPFSANQELYKDPKVNDVSDANIRDNYENNNFKTGFPDFQDYLDSLFGYEYNAKNFEEYVNEPFDDEFINIDNDECNNFDYPTQPAMSLSQVAD